MGYEIIKPKNYDRTGNLPFISVNKTLLTLNTAFVRERGWRTDKKYTVVLMIDTETGRLCMDFHDGPFPSSFTVRWRKPSTRHNVAPYCSIAIPKDIELKPGRYSYEFDGRVCKTDIQVVKKK